MYWSKKLAYAIGLIVTDGSLSKDGRHISFVSKDREQIENFLSCLNRSEKVGFTLSGTGSACLRVQFSDVRLYNFLLKIGLMTNKSKRIGALKIPKKLFADFLRGHFDGDGSIHAYYDKRWLSSYLVYTSFVSASEDHIGWLRGSINDLLGIRGHITKARQSSIFQLKYAKYESQRLLSALYYRSDVIALPRKRDKVESILAKIIN